MPKPAEEREIRFEAPVTISQLEQIVHGAMNELGFVADWTIEFGHRYDGSSKEDEIRYEHAHGHIWKGSDQIIEFDVYHGDNGPKEPIFGKIEFKPASFTVESYIERYNIYINQVYSAFQKSYEEVSAQTPENK